MKHNNRTRWLSLIALLSLVLPSAALEQREFTSADKTKTFTATLTEYNEAKKMVTVQFKNGGTKRFSIDLLSEDDQKYVTSSADDLAVSRSVNVTFKEVKGDSTRTKAGLVRTQSTPTSYEIQVFNRSDQVIKDLEVRYSFYYCVGSSSATGPRHTPKVQKGSLIYPKLFGKYTETRPTSEVALVRESKKGVSPPVPSGGGGGGGWCQYDYPDGRQDNQEVLLCESKNAPGTQPGYRRIDHVIGIAADILLDGKVIKTVASSPFMMKKHKEGSIK